ncbi:DNA-binding protein YbaB [Antricoccus suffuscus]|uniref:DNA-binding protein YbaB n=1 Tax=Antricoccus suffuscus TaxID=1629062 RepID=A0A2T0ZZI7_9ACTN|nr:YbaB/EbfC family nucleoid-associated protein [Antricoccus suffuscus]PRZ41762.1 DNA-binding protein YbaB [Antricoccus suffuscus]
MTSSDLPDVAGVKAYAEQLQSSFEKMLVEGPKVAAAARAVSITKKSKDGLITVTVSARGELEKLELDPRIYRRPDSRELAESIVEVTQAAIAEAKEAVIEIFEKIAPRQTLERHMDGDIEGISNDMRARMMGRE